MNKTIWTGVIVAIIFAGGGFYGGMQYQASKVPARGAGFAAGAGAAAFAGRGGGGTGFAAGGAGGGGTFGTIIDASPTSITIQLPTSTSTTATTGTKIVLLDNATQISALETVQPSSLKAGQSVTVTGTANADGSMTASSIQVRPASMGGRGAGTGAIQTSGQ